MTGFLVLWKKQCTRDILAKEPGLDKSPGNGVVPSVGGLHELDLPTATPLSASMELSLQLPIPMPVLAPTRPTIKDMLAKVAKARGSPIQAKKKTPAAPTAKSLPTASPSLPPFSIEHIRPQSRVEEEKELVDMVTPVD
ncbi:hypothetical protein QYF36_021974 [Acer negundo]|nr:hypothetical protein QYF36_021974 [Acer negundo]